MLNLKERTNNSVQLSNETDKALYLNDEGKLVLKDQAGTIEEISTGGGGTAYLSYVALLTQTGTNSPVATVIENTLGENVVWSRRGEGQYTLTKDTPFTLEKVFWQIGGHMNVQQYQKIYHGGVVSGGPDLGKFYLNTYAGIADIDNVLFYTLIEIRVYP